MYKYGTKIRILESGKEFLKFWYPDLSRFSIGISTQINHDIFKPTYKIKLSNGVYIWFDAKDIKRKYKRGGVNNV